MTATSPRILPCGDAALVFEFGDTVDDAVNAKVLALDAAIARAAIPGLIETVPTYRSLLVHYDPLAIDFATLSARLRPLADNLQAATGRRRCWRVPVVYGGEFGIDLEAVAKRHGISPDEVVRIHTSGDYYVAMLGFMPGFAYLAGLDARIATPRRDEPRTMTPAGTISIGGVQAGVQCLAAPSGWNLLGRTPVRTYHPQRDPVFLIEPGDAVAFYAIDESRWHDLDLAAAEGEPVAELVPA
jgi:KipI family sensor histidine kinase inhibitor